MKQTQDKVEAPKGKILETESPFQHFEHLVKRVVSVPKTLIVRQEKKQHPKRPQCPKPQTTSSNSL